jgi:hypothetical protein
MARSAKRPEPILETRHPIMEAAGAVGALVGRNPALVGGTTAFLVSLSFVSANALWYQPFSHPSAFFNTRDIDRGALSPELTETTIHIERPRQIEGDPTVKTVQDVLKQLDLYGGSVDGFAGPATRRAVEAYQQSLGLPVTGIIDETLLKQLDTGPTAGITPQPRPKTGAPEIAEPLPARFDGADESAAGRIRKVQAGLREFGRKDVDIDGVLGARTRAAIMEFQDLFGLKKTGEPDEALFAKMRKENLIN